jgi:hypothetical protein
MNEIWCEGSRVFGLRLRGKGTMLVQIGKAFRKGREYGDARGMIDVRGISTDLAGRNWVSV